MLFLDYMIGVHVKFSNVRDKYGHVTDKRLIHALNKLCEKNDVVIQYTDLNSLNTSIKKNRKRSIHATKLDKALDDYIRYKENTDDNVADFTDCYKFISSKLNSNVINPNDYFWEHRYYFMIRRSYSKENYIALSVIKFIRDNDNNTIRYKSYRYRDTLQDSYISEGAVFTNSSQTIGISGIVKSTARKKVEVLMEHIYLNIYCGNRHIYNGVYLGCCSKSNPHTPFATRVCFIPIDNNLVTTDDIKKDLERFSVSFSINDDYKDVTALIALLKDRYTHIDNSNKAYSILCDSLKIANITMKEIVEKRIVCAIDDRGEFGGLREFGVY